RLREATELPTHHRLVRAPFHELIEGRAACLLRLLNPSARSDLLLLSIVSAWGALRQRPPGLR
ncbi:MAG: hypothetical protein QF464_05565, partial [Myxococcota bacterium]|nr:hypothetical protein [Myxococcota bacterium]